MISSQVIRSCLEELCSITRTEFCVQDPGGNVLAATENMPIPDTDLIVSFARSAVDSQIVGSSYSLKVRDDEETVLILTAAGENDYTFMVARMAVSELQHLVEAYKEKLDRNSFFQNLLLDNLLPVDIHNRSRKLRIPYQVPRAILLFEVETEQDRIASELLSGLFTVGSGDYLTEVDENRVILIKSLDDPDSYPQLEESARTAVDMLNMEAMVKVRASYGTIVEDLGELSRSYKEACMAMDVGKIFRAEYTVSSYNELGIGRLIYQLPVGLCRMFLQEIFGDSRPMELDNELQTTVNTFLENNLNVSETSRQLFVHRNTLVYRIEKLQKSTGLDIRTFEDAMTLRIAMMVSAYMRYQDSRDRQ